MKRFLAAAALAAALALTAEILDRVAATVNDVAIPESEVDVYLGIGGAPEAVLAAAGIKCLGGEMQARMWPRDQTERGQLIADGYEKEIDRVFLADDLAQGENIIFCATGISDSALLKGVRLKGKTAELNPA